MVVVKVLMVLYFSFALDAEISGATVLPVAVIVASNFLSFKAWEISDASLSWSMAKPFSSPANTNLPLAVSNLSMEPFFAFLSHFAAQAAASALTCSSRPDVSSV